MNHSRSLLSMLVIAAFVSLYSCAPSIKTTASWLNKEIEVQQPRNSVFIMVLTENLETKTILENDLAQAAALQGINAHKSMEAFGPVTGKESLPVKEAILQKITDLNCDAIFTVSLVDKQSETRYVPGSTTIYAPYPHYGYYGRFGGYYGYASGFYSPGYYQTDKTYFIEANLYDAKNETLLASIQSKADNPPSIQKSSKLYTQSLIKEMQELGLLKNK